METNFESLHELIVQLSSNDLAVSQSAKEKLIVIFTPENLLAAFTENSERSTISSLLSEVCEVRNVDVLKFVNCVLEESLSCESIRCKILCKDVENVLCTFVIKIFADDEINVATTITRELVLKILIEMERYNRSVEVCSLLNLYFNNEKVLRFFDCDRPLSEYNREISQYLSKHTNFIPKIADVIIKCYDQQDLLLLSNYLSAYGIICRWEEIDNGLLSKVETALDNRKDKLTFIFTCHFCSNVIYAHSPNAQRYGEIFINPITSSLPTEKEVDLLDSVCTLIGAASTTREGWRCVEICALSSWAEELLECSLCTSRLAALGMLLTFAHSEFVSSQYFTTSLIQSVWKLRLVPEVELKIKVWELMLSFIERSELVDAVALFCASYLCGQITYDEMEIRLVQMRVAQLLIDRANVLPINTKRSLERVVRQGIYPAGSAGVALLEKHEHEKAQKLTNFTM